MAPDLDNPTRGSKETLMIKNRCYPSLIIHLLCATLLGCSGSTTTESAARTGALLGGMSDGWAGAATGAILGGVLVSAVDHAADPSTAYRPQKTNMLVGSTWRVVSLVDESGMTNSKFSIHNGQMVVVTPEARAVLEEIEDGA